MTGSAFEPVRVPDWAWRRDDTRRLLRDRDVAGLFQFAQKYGGASQSRIAASTGILQGRVSELMAGSRRVTRLEVFERIADGLNMPDDARMLFGLAPRHVDPVGFAEVAEVFPSQSAAARQIRRLAGAATAIDVLAVRGLGLLGLNDSLLRSTIAESHTDGLRVRVLLLDADSVSAERRASEIGETIESFTSGIRLAVARLRELSERSGIAVQVYQYGSLPVWRLIGIDGTLYVSAFDETWEGHESAVYKITETPGGALHRGFRRHFEDLCRSSTRVM
jgi:transcriptional regulator with XRE-family HTH domain